MTGDAGQTLRNAGWLLAQRGLHVAGAALFAVLVPRLMGPETFGRYALLTSVSLWFAAAERARRRLAHDAEHPAVPCGQRRGRHRAAHGALLLRAGVVTAGDLATLRAAVRRNPRVSGADSEGRLAPPP